MVNAVPAINEAFRNLRLVVLDMSGTPIELTIEFFRTDFKTHSTAIGCKTHGSAVSPKRLLDVHEHACEAFSPQPLTMDFSLDFASKAVLKPALVKVQHPHAQNSLAQ